MKRWLILLVIISFPHLLALASPLPRGILMLDVSRHFMPMSFLYRQVNEMARYGIPALHLHLTDAAGWRLEIRSYPELTARAAWRTAPLWADWWNDGRRLYADQRTGYGGYYTQEEMRRLVRYARSRGVSIIPEIEFPAHSEEVTTALPWLSCTGRPYTSADLCIGSDSTYIFLSNVLREVCDIFPSTFVHMGGDEAAGLHWQRCPRCQGTTQAKAMQRVAGILKGMGRRMICWDDVLGDEPLDSSVVIMLWRQPEAARLAQERGHEVIMAPSRYCYLDKYQDAPFAQPRAMGGYLPLDTLYRHLLDLRSWPLALCLWTEYVPTPHDAERMLWPRALALAEALRPRPRRPKAFRRWAQRETRLLRARGIHAFDLDGEVGQRPQHEAPSKHLARGARVTYTTPFHPLYPAAGESALTDGRLGGWANTDGRWQGFLGPMDLTIDLGRQRTIRSVDVTFLQSRGVEIYLPSRFTVSVSNDLHTWTPLADQLHASDPRPDVLHTFRWQSPGHGTPSPQRAPSPLPEAVQPLPQRARYLRLEARPDASGGWLFVDEVVVH